MEPTRRLMLSVGLDLWLSSGLTIALYLGGEQHRSCEDLIKESLMCLIRDNSRRWICSLITLKSANKRTDEASGLMKISQQKKSKQL